MPLISSLRFLLTHPINRREPVKALLRVAKWQAGTRLVPGPVVFNWIGGTRFIVRRGEAGLTGNVYCGLHEFADMAFVLHVLGPGDCFVDVGANVGSYTILACGVRKARGHCFEPVPETFGRLMDNLRLNDLSARVEAHNAGVSDEPGELWFSTNEDCTNHVIEGPDASPKAALVKSVTLDSTLGDVAVSLMKIDVEGLETRVLGGAAKTLSAPALHSVIMELNGSGARYGYRDESLVEKMAAYGFHEYAYEPFERKLHRVHPAGPRSGNSIFVRDHERVARRVAEAPQFEVFGVRV